MTHISHIGLISATEKESRIIIRNLKKETVRSFHTGRIGAVKIALVVSGMGKTNASHAATLLIERFNPNLVINFGIAGAYPKAGLRKGDIAIAEKEIYGDEGLLLKDGFHTADEIGISLFKKGRKRYFNKFLMDKTLVRKVIDTFMTSRLSIATGTKIKSGTFITLSTSTGTSKKANEIEKRFNAICENMEGAAVAHICAIYGIPALEIRGISNIVENRDKNRWDIEKASANCQRTVMEFLGRI